jgi:NAD(P)-dependent dehydrogenase (short-subunit alcohol dehydrogenase family)
VKLGSDSLYLLPGGIGGIGRGLARYVAGIGCKTLIVLSRSAEQHEEVPELVKELGKMGCNVLIRNCDVANPSDLRSLLSALKDEQVAPIEGVTQAAMALQVSETHGCI